MAAGGVEQGFLEREYDTRPGDRGNARRFARWLREADRALVRHPPRTLRYGPGDRRAIDLFVPHGAANPPVLLFLHGGYWQRRTRREFAWLVPAWLGQGFAVALVGYPLCPEVGFARLVGEVQGSIARLWREAPRLGLSREWVIAGHSAGGHLAASLAATDWSAMPGRMPRSLFAACVAVSGVFDLCPLLGTTLNAALRLDRETAAAFSPHAHCPPPGLPVVLAVGGAESGEFQRQTRQMAESWHARGAEVAQLTLPGCNHFTVLEALARPRSALFAAVRGLAGPAGHASRAIKARASRRTR